ncbi:cupin domain-containing protein [Rhodobacteraceae bacterium NNCM2]|nr:cupin domain-containing protein [Coraliihabitans acroporae]
MTVSSMAEAKDAEAEARAAWPRALQEDFARNRTNGHVGSVLVSETDDLRVWHLHLPPGKRCPFHRHVLNYFWTCHSHGSARGYYEDGRIVDVTHYPGDTKHFDFPKGEGFTHSVENIGDTDLLFTTVEFKRSANEPLPVDDGIRLKLPPEAPSWTLELQR